MLWYENAFIFCSAIDFYVQGMVPGLSYAPVFSTGMPCEMNFFQRTLNVLVYLVNLLIEPQMINPFNQVADKFHLNTSM
jgi:hypothetical protein